MPFGQINQIGQGEVSPGRRRSYDQSLSRSFAAAGAIGYRGNFQSAGLTGAQGNPLFHGRKADYYGRSRNTVYSDISNRIEAIFRYSTPLLSGISPTGFFSGMHPGNSGYGTSVIRGMTDFGSGWRGLIGISPEIAKMLTANYTDSAGFVITPGRATVDMGSGPLSSLQNMVREGAKNDPSAQASASRFISDIDDALAAGYHTPEVAFVKTGLKDGPNIRNIIRHERQHIYSNVTEGKAANAMQKSTIAGARRVFLKERNVRQVAHYGEEYLAYMSGFKGLNAKQLSRELEGLSSPVKAQVQRDITALGPRIEHTRKSAKFSWLTQRRTSFGASDSYVSKRNTMINIKMNSPQTIARHAITRLQQSTSDALKSRPTVGLVGVLAKAAKGASKFMSRIAIR
jgi:hypothetical protein